MNITSKIAAILLFVLCSLLQIDAQDLSNGNSRFDELIANRQALKTTTEDVLLRRLESDFVRLLKTANRPDRMLEAERLLDETNDNTHWTNYSKATSVIRLAPERAAIPLLLRYMVVHTQRSAAHIMIPEYEKTLTLITGCEFAPGANAGDNSEQAMRLRVKAFVESYWDEEAQKESPEPSAVDLRVVAAALLEESRRKGDFTGSGGGIDTAYRAYHNVYYRIRSSSSQDSTVYRDYPKGITPYLLEPYGFQLDSQQSPEQRATDGVISVDVFPYEAIPLLAELANNGERDWIAKVADDVKQNATVRMACIYSLFRAGGDLRAESLIDILKLETRLERRLIILLSLRWAGDGATDVLMSYLNDDSVEVATAAACALCDARPDAALPRIKRLLQRDHSSTTSLVYSTLGKWKTFAARRFLAESVASELQNNRNDSQLNQALSAFVEAADLPRANWRSSDYSLRAAAEIALKQYQISLAKAKADRDRSRIQAESIRIQWTAAKEIQSIRKSEYKRLLELQGDEVVTAEESKVVRDRLTEIQAEVDVLQTKLFELEARVAATEVCDEPGSLVEGVSAKTQSETNLAAPEPVSKKQ